MPDIPQMASVWQDLGAAWVRSTKGFGFYARAAVLPRRFEKIIAQKIG